MTLTSQYHFASLTVGNYITVVERFQHARVAASEFARRHGMVFSCRMQPDGTMRVYRVAADQAKVDVRGRTGKRRIPARVDLPTKAQFMQWLDTLPVGTLYYMPISYASHYMLFDAWIDIYNMHQRSMRIIRAAIQPDGRLLVAV
jgi:hypothetical protein